MKVSLRATYGIIAAVDLALHHAEHPVCAKSIAKQQAIPLPVPRASAACDEEGGSGDESARSARQVCVESKTPELSVADILDALKARFLSTNGDAAPETDLVTSFQARGAPCAYLGSCETGGTQRVIRVTVELAKRQRALDEQHTLMYHI